MNMEHKKKLVILEALDSGPDDYVCQRWPLRLLVRSDAPFVTTGWHVLRVWTEETAAGHGGQLYGQPTIGGPQAWWIYGGRYVNVCLDTDKDKDQIGEGKLNWGRHVARMGEVCTRYRPENLKERDSLKELNVRLVVKPARLCGKLDSMKERKK